MCKYCDDNGCLSDRDCPGYINRFNYYEPAKLPEGHPSVMPSSVMRDTCYIKGCQSHETTLEEGRGGKEYMVCKRHIYYHRVMKSFVKIYN